MPSAEEILNGADNLEKADFQVDYVLTHEPSGRSSGYVSADTPLNGVNVFSGPGGGSCDVQAVVFRLPAHG